MYVMRRSRIRKYPRLAAVCLLYLNFYFWFGEPRYTRFSRPPQGIIMCLIECLMDEELYYFRSKVIMEVASVL